MNFSTHLREKAVAAHVLRHLAREGARGRLVSLEDLAQAIGVESYEARSVVTCLHDEGHVDAKRMRLTLTGLALAAAMRNCKLIDLHFEEILESKVA
jgi:hypothetical protein